jgi:hypothetical protein
VKKYLLLLILALPLSAKAQEQVLPINKFGGINTDGSVLTIYPQVPDSQNVVTDYQGGVQPRLGFITFSTENPSGLWTFGKSDGSRWMIAVSSNQLKAATASSFSITIATISTAVPTYGTPFGDRFYFINKVDGLKAWDGNSIVFSSPTMLGDKITTFAGRVAIGNVSGNARVLYLSKLYDGTNYIPPTNSSDDDAAQITVSGLQDENIEGIYPFQNILVIFKPNSFQGLYGSRRSNFSLRVFSNVIGLSGQESIQDCDGKLRWLSKGRKVYEFDGATFQKISEGVDNLFATIAQGDQTNRSLTLTSQADWQASSFSTHQGWLNTSISAGSVVLDTAAAPSTFGDTLQADFNAGTTTNLSTTSKVDSLELSKYSTYGDSQMTGSGKYEFTSDHFPSGCTGTSYPLIQVISSTNSIFVTGVYVYIAKYSGYDQDAYVSIEYPVGSYHSIEISNASIGTSLGWVFADFGLPGISIPSGVQFSVYLGHSGSYTSGKGLKWEYETSGSPYSTNASSQSYVAGCPLITTTNTRKYRFFLVGLKYNPSGTFTSRAWDTSIDTNTWLSRYLILTSSANIPSGTGITFQTLTSSAADMTGSYDTLKYISTGSYTTANSSMAVYGDINSKFLRYIQVKATLSTILSNTTPSMDNYLVYLDQKRRPSGTLKTLVNYEPNLKSWGAFTPTYNSDGTQNFYIRSSTSWFPIDSTTYTWTSIINNRIPTISTGSYFQFRDDFAITLSTQNPSLDEIRQYWMEGSLIRMTSAYTNQRYWLSVAVNSNSNNKIFLYDRANQWQKYDGINADAMVMQNSILYFGNSTGVYQAEQGTTDNGNPITSYYQTATMVPTSPQLWHEFNKLYLTTENSDATLSTTFRLNGIPTDYPMGTYQMNNTTGIQDLKLPFSLSEANQGKNISFKWTVVGSSFWRLLNGSIYYTPGLEPD